MLNETAINEIKDSVQNTFGQTAQPMNEHPVKRDEIMSFSKVGVHVNFNFNSYFDERKGDYQEPAPGISFSYNRKYVSIPTDPELLSELGHFFIKVGDVAKSLPPKKTTYVNDDVEAAKKKLAKFRAA